MHMGSAYIVSAAEGKRLILTGTHCKLFCFVSVGKPERETERSSLKKCYSVLHALNIVTEENKVIQVTHPKKQSLWRQ